MSKETPEILKRVAATLIGLTLCFVIAAPLGYGQSLTGRWAATGRTLDNGEQEKYLLDLKEVGDQLTGTLTTLGFSADVRGTATGNHFELFAPWNEKRPFLTGELVNGELHAIQGRHRQWLAKPATPADELPQIPYIDPPALHAVPRDGLAKTPPMGWNSWNLFAGKVDFVPQQAPDFLKSVGDQMLWKSVRVVTVAKILCEPLQEIHVFGEVLWYMRLQNFEDTTLSLSGLGIFPFEAHNRTDTCLLQNVGGDFDRVDLVFWAQLSLDDRPNIFRFHIADSVLEPGQRIAQRWTQMRIARNHLA